MSDDLDPPYDSPAAPVPAEAQLAELAKLCAAQGIELSVFNSERHFVEDIVRELEERKRTSSEHEPDGAPDV